ncbi:polyadenylate-binding protein-interacting protein 7-like [Phragmites australis]|uniref:polyadenylate-binding protein-interacting protein 7-like n=1 Tax=Phragmites australis TaxID=29695 RepID=UPI002D79EDFA|nr:polyadenylate-binding protein-interacting protein 7-like [Phragmites australis]
MSSLNKVVSNSGDACSVLPSKVTALNPNAAEFVPSFIRPSFGSSTVPDVTKSDFRGSSGKSILDRSESSKSNNSDDEAHQFWRKQLPDDIIPDFTSFEKIEQRPEELSLAGLSLNAPPFYGTTSSRLSREHHELSSPASKGLELEHTNLLYEDNSQTTFSALGSSNWEQNYMGDLHFANGSQDLPLDSESAAGFSDSFASEYAAASDGGVDPLEYLASQFPGFSAESLAELYYANGCDFNHTIEILAQLEMQVDATPNHTLNLTHSTPNFSTGDFPALPTAEDHNSFNKGNVDVVGIFNRRGLSTMSSGTGDFVSAVRKLASQNSGHWKFKKGPEYGNGVSALSVPKQYSSSTKQSSGNKFQSVSSARVAPWLETGDAVANMYSESRGEARDFARVRNACFEQARQAYLVGNKALAKELSMKGQAYNAQMKAAHEKAREAIYRQRNPVSSQRGSDHLIDLHGLHVSEAIHILKVELAALKGARATGERMQVMVCVGTGHHTKGSRTARLPIAVEQFLLDEGLHYTQPQPGLLRVMVY